MYVLNFDGCSFGPPTTIREITPEQDFVFLRALGDNYRMLFFRIKSKQGGPKEQPHLKFWLS